jgi:hypothetical protein
MVNQSLPPTSGGVRTYTGSIGTHRRPLLKPSQINDLQPRPGFCVWARRALIGGESAIQPKFRRTR